ncbi:MAG: acetyl-CoA decarbonylase/synthase complex subunit delta [Euryarchaeota archaeon]|nr:acetyl-CoA decarbonylase/synthase complex subunit delta [Euryarchaeota archaeon]MBV1729103.1 acetyl-CoA decarbonylase/synthase complex subunit delta [Methanobacterium sp.]MBU4548117.1 acetyl-CoA decarbonylase/synthase complex subunit delta [Euryarchaeota archaeon]MBU4608425.1 acetyl-CoA decarbonylase/synthase complex subunit delta [Euryarchaeota archaeon]MBV1755330.1 acetyl-CoA decarbonylase/synthase complex subunit delta [Methanobacterium sp.]
MDKMTQLLKLLENTKSIEINDFRMDFDELELQLMPAVQQVVQQAVQTRKAASEVLPMEDFKPPIQDYPGKVAEVQLGKGSRKPVYLGGQQALYRFEEAQPNAPVVTFDVFDIPMPGLPRPIREHFSDVMDHPGEWAKKAVKEFGANMVTIHLIGTGPKVMDKSPREAANDIEEVLQAVDVPLVIGASGDPVKDPLVLEKAAEAAQGERCLLASANLDLDYQKVAQAAVNNDHAVLSWSITDVNMQKTLNRYLLKEGLTQNDIVMDPTTCALGYGIEFSIDIMTRTRLAALKGDTDLQMPMSSGTTNAWGSREAWMKKEEWGPTDYRGPIWEIFTGLTMMLNGVDIFMMLHPTSVKLLREIGGTFVKDYMTTDLPDISDWITQLEG